MFTCGVIHGEWSRFSLALKVEETFVAGARKESGAGCHWSRLSHPPPETVLQSCASNSMADVCDDCELSLNFREFCMIRLTKENYLIFSQYRISKYRDLYIAISILKYRSQISRYRYDIDKSIHHYLLVGMRREL